MTAPPETTDAGRRFDELVALIARLRAPGGCPWDREQTHQSVKPMTIEEAYEVAEAIDEGDDHALAAELGDLALQVVFHAQIAADEKRFTVVEVECLGACGFATPILVNDDFIEGVTPERVAGILAGYK